MKTQAEIFNKKFLEGQFDLVNLNLNEALLESFSDKKTKAQLKEDPNLYNTEINLSEGYDITNAPYFGFDSNHQTLFIKSVPKDCPRRTLEKIFEEMEGYICLSLSEPLRTQEFVRFGWVIFDSNENCAKAVNLMSSEEIKRFDLSIVKNKQQRRFIRILQNFTKKRLEQHNSLSAELIKNLDSEKGIQGNILLEKPKTDMRLQFDLQVLYLRKVHFYCYFSTAVISRILLHRSSPMKEPLQQSVVLYFVDSNSKRTPMRNS